MKRSAIIFVLSQMLATYLPAQGINNTGAYIVMNGAAQIYIDGNGNGDYTSSANGRITPSATGIVTLEGDWNNNAGNTGFTADAGTVVMNGGAQFITGTSTTTFYNLTLLGTGSKTLNVPTFVGGAVTTTGVLSLGARPLVLNSNMLTITNPAAGAITFTTGYIQSETNVAANPSIVRWQMGTTTGAHVFPFGTAGGTQIPLTFNKTTAIAADVDIATRPTATSANTPWSAGVTHMFDPTLAQDGSDEAVIDRWWDMTASANITADVTFSYTGFENTLAVPYNAGNLGAQYWSAAWLPNNLNIGSAPAVLAGVGSVTASGLSVTTTFTPWVLSSVGAPLPVELVSFTSACDHNNVQLTWMTASEQNNSHFTIERSDDGVAYRAIGIIPGANTSSQIHSYTFTDTEPTTGTTYYRLRQTDFNGQETTTSPLVQEQCGTNGETIHAFSNGGDLAVSIYTPSASEYTVSVYDDQGKLLMANEISAAEGANRFTFAQLFPAVGIYMVVVTGDSGITYSGKLYLQK